MLFILAYPYSLDLGNFMSLCLLSHVMRLKSKKLHVTRAQKINKKIFFHDKRRAGRNTANSV